MLAEKKNYPWVLVCCYSLLGICFPATVTQFSMLAETISGEIGIPAHTLMLADSLRAVCLVIAMFSSSAVHRRLGLRKTMALGVAFQALPQFLIPLAVHIKFLPLLFLAKGMQGLNAVAFPLYISTITSWMDSRWHGLSTSIFNGSFMAGAGLGAWVSGRLVPAFGWRFSFFAIGCATVLLAAPALLLTREKPMPSGKRNRPGVQDRNKLGSVIRNPSAWLLVSALLAHTWTSQAITVDMPLFSGYSGYTLGQTGTLMLVISLVTIASSISAGAVSDYAASKAANKLGARVSVLVAGYAVSAAASLTLPHVSGRYWGMVFAASMMMMGVSWAQGVFWALPGSLFAQERLIAVSSFCSGASNLVNPLAPMVAGVLLGARGMWAAAWATCATMAALSTVGALLLVKRGNAGDGTASHTMDGEERYRSV